MIWMMRQPAQNGNGQEMTARRQDQPRDGLSATPARQHLGHQMELTEHLHRTGNAYRMQTRLSWRHAVPFPDAACGTGGDCPRLPPYQRRTEKQTRALWQCVRCFYLKSVFGSGRKGLWTSPIFPGQGFFHANERLRPTPGKSPRPGPPRVIVWAAYSQLSRLESCRGGATAKAWASHSRS